MTERPAPAEVFDGGDMACGELILALRGVMSRLRAGEVLRLVSRDPGAPADLPAWCRITGHRLLWAEGHDYYIQRRET